MTEKSEKFKLLTTASHILKKVEKKSPFLSQTTQSNDFISDVYAVWVVVGGLKIRQKLVNEQIF